MPQTKIHSKNLQRATTPKIIGIELWFLYAALFCNVINLCVKFEVGMIYLYVKFEVTSLHTFEVMPLTKNPKLKFIKGSHSKIVGI